jgi:DNA-binding MarR family transcriptional regulator
VENRENVADIVALPFLSFGRRPVGSQVRADGLPIVHTAVVRYTEGERGREYFGGDIFLPQNHMDDKAAMTTREREMLLGEVAQAIAQLQSATNLVDEAAAAALGIHRTDLRCLGLLLAHGPMPAGHLGVAAHLSPGATTAAIDRLERAGYVRRLRPGGDRRSVLVEPTPAGRERIAAIYGPIGRAGMEHLARYREADLRLLLEFLREGYRLQVEQAARIRATSGAAVDADGPASDAVAPSEKH